MVEPYDVEAAATGWRGPELAFGLARDHARAGQSILDIGIGTGLGSLPFRAAGLNVFGMDVSQDMLDACGRKGFTHLKRHDLTDPPYPYQSASVDHAVCVGVLQFFSDLSTVFGEIARILKEGGVFVFVVGDRTENEAADVVVGVDSAKSDRPITMYRHTQRQISGWANAVGFTSVSSVAFTMYQDRQKDRSFPARAYLVRKTASS
jgi:predicted TPR repeat methyltransferase